MKKFDKKKINSFTPVVLIIAICLLAVIIAIPNLYSKADPATATADITATLFDTTEYLTGTQLTEAGGEVTGWLYGTNKYLQIDPDVPNDGNRYKIVVEMPKEFYAVVNSVDVPSGYESAEFTKNDTFPINNNQTYSVNQYSGKFEYMMSEGQTSGTIQLAITYDEVLWANMANESITESGVKPIIVTLKKIDENNNETIVKEISIKDAKAGDGRTYSQSMYMNDIGNGVLLLKEDEVMECDPFYLNSQQNTYSFFFKKLRISCKKLAASANY